MKLVDLHGTDTKAMVDDEVYEKIKDHKYYKSTAGYVVRRAKKGDKKWKLVLLQKEVLAINGIDKKARFNDGDKLNCQLENLIVKGATE